jgi:glycosyltransferase involved in cell wall biosynthesis
MVFQQEASKTLGGTANMGIAVICPAVKGAMGYHIRTIAQYFPNPNQLLLYVPDTFVADDLSCEIIKYRISNSNLAKTILYFNLLWARQRFLEVRRLKPDIVHLFNSEGYPSSWLLARWVRRELQKPFIISVHDPEPHPGTLIGAFTHQVGRRTWRLATHIHLFSECFIPTIQRYGVPVTHIFVIPLCTDPSIFTRHAQPNIQREPLVLFFGRLEAYKGLSILIAAAEKLRGQFKFAIAGPGRLPRSLLSRIQAQPDLFELYNYFLHESEVAILFQRASVCVMPYIQATQSSVPYIAAAFSVSVVATNTGGLADQVKQIDGVLVPPKDAEALAKGILEAYGRPVKFPPEWEPSIIVSKYFRMYEEVISKTQPKQISRWGGSSVHQ